MISGKSVDKYLNELIRTLGWQEALIQLSKDVQSGKIGYTPVKVRDNDDNWIEPDIDQSRKVVEETYLIYVKDRTGVNHTILIDESNYSRVSEYVWWVRKDSHGEYFASTNVDGKFISLQQFIFGLPPRGKKLYFKDKNKLNCRRSNVKFYTDKHAVLRYKQKYGYSFED